jgi:polysaccharide biosynthesis protein PslH
MTPPAGRPALLVVSAQFPYPPRFGFARRVAHLIAELAEHCDVTLLTYGSAEDRELDVDLPDGLTVELVALRPAGALRRRLAQAASLVSRQPYACRSLTTPEMQRAIDRLVATRRFDVIQLESSLLCGFRLPPEIPVLIDEHNLEYEVLQRMQEGERSRLRRAFSRLEARRVRRFEERCWAAAAACAVTSEREEAIVRRVAPSTRVATVPNGVDTAEFGPPAGQPSPETVVFNGLLRYRPNLDAACFLVDEVWPRVLALRPGARLSVVGKGTPGELRRVTGPNVSVTGEVPDVRPYLAGAAVVVVPVRMGGGTRLKVVEALAMEKAIVTTSLGCEGIAVQDGREVLIADDAAAMSGAILRLFDDPALAARLGRAGRELAIDRYSWHDAGRRLLGLVWDVVGERDGDPVAAGTAAP